MKYFLFLFMILACKPLLAQDPEFPDYRSKRENFLKLPEKDIRADLAAFTLAGIEESMGKTVPPTIPVSGYGPDFMQFEGNGIKVRVKSGLFNPAKHKLMMYEEKHLLRIDGKPFYGSFGKIPKRTIDSLTVMVGKDTLAVPATAIFDLYNPGFTYYDGQGDDRSFNRVFQSKDGRKIYVYFLTRQPGDNYEVTWIFQDKKYLKRVLDFGILK